MKRKYPKFEEAYDINDLVVAFIDEHIHFHGITEDDKAVRLFAKEYFYDAVYSEGATIYIHKKALDDDLYGVTFDTEYFKTIEFSEDDYYTIIKVEIDPKKFKKFYNQRKKDYYKMMER